MILFLDGKKFTEHKYATEEDFERDVVLSSKEFFGKETVYIDAKKKIESKGSRRCNTGWVPVRSFGQRES
jgi:hypothetical protein